MASPQLGRLLIKLSELHSVQASFQMNPSQDAVCEQDAQFLLDPTQMPQRLELDLSDELLGRLMRQAERSNRSLSELIEHILAQSFLEMAEEA